MCAQRPIELDYFKHSICEGFYIRRKVIDAADGEYPSYFAIAERYRVSEPGYFISKEVSLRSRFMCDPVVKVIGSVFQLIALACSDITLRKW